MLLENVVSENSFIIDSDELDSVKNRLCGTIATKSGNLFVNEFPDDNIGSGCYVLIERASEKIIISQDVLRCFDIYIYQESGKFLISNSFFLLSERLAGKLTLNESYMLQLIYCYTTPYDSVGTLANEITRVPLHSHIEIDIKTKTLEIKKNDYQFFQKKFDPKETTEILDAWYFKWLSIYRRLVETGNPISIDVSGGLDSRINFSIMLDSGIDIGRNVIINNHQKDFHLKDPEDREICKRLVMSYGLLENTNSFVMRTSRFFEPDLSYSVLKYFLFGRSLYCKTKDTYFCSPYYTIKGLGQMLKVGVPEETIAFYNEQNKSFIDSLVSEVDKEKFLSDFNVSSERYNDFLDSITDSNFFNYSRQNLFIGGRDDKKILFSYLRGNIPVLPLVDPQLWVFDPHMSDDPWFLSTLILARYNPKLLEFPLQGGREFSKDTIAFVNSVNSQYPVNKPVVEKIVKQSNPMENWYCADMHFDTFLKTIYSSKDFRDSFKPYFTDETVQAIIDEKPVRKRNVGNYRPTALLAIYEFLKLIK